ncbi:MAG: 30S ribosomal protein S21 [Candidatus Nanoarchaeia archaeon]|jgi:small subunit ribosomal protein S21|nr:30S ribosomal protein S21 [Candidatus Nanoarchaeia archaeon]
MNGVFVRSDEGIEHAIRRFIKTCERSGVLSELKKYRYYEKPSDEKKRKLNTSIRRNILQEKINIEKGKRKRF